MNVDKLENSCAQQPLTDRSATANQEEFVWDTTGCTEVHRFTMAPIVSLLREAAAQRVLDLGCGNGAFTAALQRQGFTMRGMDHSETGIAIAKREHPDIKFSQHDLARPIAPEFSSQFDAVVSHEVIEHLLLPRQLMQSALCALKPGGLLIVTAPYHGYFKNLALALANKFDDHWHPLRDYGHIKFFSKRTLTSLFAEYGLLNVKFSTVGRVPMFARSMVLAGRKAA
jgi:2-polyprenyl-6-hydroxyphenyl methylase/3-demethylubiquinone-9 3-methyltransferase